MVGTVSPADHGEFLAGGLGWGLGPGGSWEVLITPVQACRLSLGWQGEPWSLRCSFVVTGLSNQARVKPVPPLESGGPRPGLGPVSLQPARLAAPLGAVRGLLPPESGEVQVENRTRVPWYTDVEHTVPTSTLRVHIFLHFISSACLLRKT